MKIEKQDYFIVFFVLFCVGFLITTACYADNYHHHSQPILPANTTTNIYSTKGVALGIAAAQHNFDYGTFSWQGSIATGSYDNSTAFSFGLGKRFKSTLINGSISNEGGKMGFGGAVGFRF